jgi:hypothetical protein
MQKLCVSDEVQKLRLFPLHGAAGQALEGKGSHGYAPIVVSTLPRPSYSATILSPGP